MLDGSGVKAMSGSICGPNSGSLWKIRKKYKICLTNLALFISEVLIAYLVLVFSSNSKPLYIILEKILAN